MIGIDAFVLRALLAGAAVAAAGGVLGCFVVWRRMAYFGDATAHAAVLGVALALIFDVSVVLGVTAVAFAVAALVTVLTRQKRTGDSTLGVIAHSALAIGLVAMAFSAGTRVNLEALLFGDILIVSWRELALIWGGAIAVIALLLWRWSALLTDTLSEDLARAAGIHAERERFVLMLALALTVALSLQVVGALLIAAMLIIPPAAARSLARTPEAMAALSVLIGLIAVGLGLALSLTFDTPAGPSIVTSATALYALSLFRRPA